MLKERGGEGALQGRAYAAAMTADAHDKAFAHVSGCEEDAAQVVNRAVNLFLDKIKLGAKGPSRHPTEHVVAPVWEPRESARRGKVKRKIAEGRSGESGFGPIGERDGNFAV